MYHVQVKNTPIDPYEKTRVLEFQFATSADAAEFLAAVDVHGWKPLRFIAKDCVTPQIALRLCIGEGR